MKPFQIMFQQNRELPGIIPLLNFLKENISLRHLIAIPLARKLSGYSILLKISEEKKSFSQKYK
jgi:hypothetical protein